MAIQKYAINKETQHYFAVFAFVFNLTMPSFIYLCQKKKMELSRVLIISLNGKNLSLLINSRI